MNEYKNIKTGILAALLVASLVVPASALEGSMGPARMTLHTEVPFMSQSVIEVPIRVCNPATESESIRFFTTDDLNNSDIMTVEFTEQQLVLMPEEERVLNVTFSVKEPGTFSGNIVTLFNSMTEESSSTVGSTVGLRLNSKVSIVAESKRPDLSLYSICALGFAGIVVLICVVSKKRKMSRREDEQKESVTEK